MELTMEQHLMEGITIFAMKIKFFAVTMINATLAYLLSYVLPSEAFIQGLILFVIIDLILGSIVSKRSGQRFEWKKAMHTVYKFILYPLAVLVANVYETDFATWLPMVDIVAGTIALFEVKSIYVHMSSLLNYDLFALIWKQVQARIDAHKLKEE